MSRTGRSLPLLLLLLLAAGAGAQETSRYAPGPYRASNLEIGELPPDFELDSLDGERYRLVAARGGHPVLLIFFRGTW